jgi:opacity protein-like surface antigen
VTDRISLRGELMHTGFGKTDHVTGSTTVSNNVSTTALRAGAAYKF